MENEKNYNFFIIGSRANGKSEKNDNIEVIVTSALGQGKYDIEEIKDQIKNLEKFSKESGGYLKVYQDDGENFWSVYSYGEKLDIGSENDKYIKWDEIRNEAKQINIKNLIDLCESVELENKVEKKLKP